VSAANLTGLLLAAGAALLLVLALLYPEKF
jgi:hypothetical protein